MSLKTERIAERCKEDGGETIKGLAEKVLSGFSEVAGKFTIYLCLSQAHMPAEPTGCVNERLGWGIRKPVTVGL